MENLSITQLMDNKSQSSLETDHCRSGFWEDDQGRDAIDTTQLCLGMGGGSEMLGRSIKEHMGWKAFQTRTFLYRSFFVKGRVTCICRYLFDPICLGRCRKFYRVRVHWSLSIQVSPQETPTWQDEFNVAMKKAEVLLVCPL